MIFNLLLVEDSLELRKILVEHLCGISNNIFTASNGIDALDMINKENIHCVVSDFNMPKMNGLELIKKIRGAGNNVPFVFFSGFGARELILGTKEYGIFDVIEKPDFDGLKETLKRGMSSGFRLHNLIIWIP